MGVFTCVSCGKVVEVEKFCAERKFCDRKCYATYLKGRNATQPDACVRHRASRHMTPAGFDNLVTAICNRAALDWMEHAPGTWQHDDAERFFRSQYFTDLTDMDGDEMLAKLQRVKDMKERKRNGRR